jgi:hypothetical protein
VPRDKGPISYTIKKEHRTKSDGRAVHGFDVNFAEFNALILSKDVTDFILIRRLPLFFGCIYSKRPT